MCLPWIMIPLKSRGKRIKLPPNGIWVTVENQDLLQIREFGEQLVDDPSPSITTGKIDSAC